MIKYSKDTFWKHYKKQFPYKIITHTFRNKLVTDKYATVNIGSREIDDNVYEFLQHKFGDEAPRVGIYSRELRTIEYKHNQVGLFEFKGKLNMSIFVHELMYDEDINYRENYEDFADEIFELLGV